VTPESYSVARGIVTPASVGETKRHNAPLPAASG
jgi:hypothetical protein